MHPAALGSKKPIPPSIHWGLDPLFHSHIKIFAWHLSNLQHSSDPCEETVAPYLGFLHFAPEGAPRPIRLIETYGTIVYRGEDSKRVRLLLDDGTGVIRVNLWKSSLKKILGVASGSGDDVCDEVLACFRLGELVHLLGRVEISYKRGRELEKVVVVQAEQIRVSTDVNEEWLWWLQVIQSHFKVYARLSNKELNFETQKTLEESMQSWKQHQNL